MIKFDSEIEILKNKLGTSKKILIVLPSKVYVDRLAAGLALYLSLKQAGKEASVVTEDTLLVAHGSIFGVGDVKNNLSLENSNNLVLTLQGVVAPDGSVPALEKLDWFPKGTDLNLVFHVLSGQTFEPKAIVPKYQNAGNFDLIFVVGAANPGELGNLYTSNIEIFSNADIIDIDNQEANSRFGKVNIVDPSTSSASEVVSTVIVGLGLPFEGDIASNILSGIYGATNNLITNVTPDTFIAVSQAMQAGGKIPVSFKAPTTEELKIPEVKTPEPAFDYRQFLSEPSTQAEPLTPQVPPVLPSISNEERPSGERAISSSPEAFQPTPDWLTPKIYKGKA